MIDLAKVADLVRTAIRLLEKSYLFLSLFCCALDYAGELSSLERTLMALYHIVTSGI